MRVNLRIIFNSNFVPRTKNDEFFWEIVKVAQKHPNPKNTPELFPWAKTEQLFSNGCGKDPEKTPGLIAELGKAINPATIKRNLRCRKINKMQVCQPRNSPGCWHQPPSISVWIILFWKTHLSNCRRKKDLLMKLTFRSACALMAPHH